MTCTPLKPMPPGYFAKLSPCDQLALYEEAAFALSSGAGRRQVRHGDNYVEYQQANLPFIERQIARLRVLCNASKGAAGRHGITIGRTSC